MIHIKKFEKFNIKGIFNKDELKKFYSELGKKFGLKYNKIDDRLISLGPKNGHEIVISIGKDACFIETSYYGAKYGKGKIVYDLENFLNQFDFNHKPNIKHKYS